MTIRKYTFFSPNGNDFPVTADADAKLYMALGNLDYTTFSRVDWSTPKQVGLTKTFVKTSFVVAGRFFQAENELVQLLPAATNFIHAVIDLSTPLNPVKFTSETTDNSNTIDINNSSGVYKRCIEKVTTNSGSIISTEKIAQNRIFDIATIKKAVINTANVVNSSVSGATNLNTLNTSGKAVLSILEVKNSTLLKDTTISGNLTVSGVTTSKYFTAKESVTSKNVKVENNTTTSTLIVKGVPAKRSEQFQTPNTYATITGTALEFFTLYKSANVVTCNFWGSPTSGSIPGGGAIVGWITDNAFKPEYTQNFTVFTANGQRCRFTVDPGGAIRSHEPVGKNVEIWDSMQWIVPGTEGGQTSK